MFVSSKIQSYGESRGFKIIKNKTMAQQRRMFSSQIVCSDAFLDMPQTTQLLYFHLVMQGDDDGFVGSPKRIMKMIGVNDDDFKILIAKRFLLVFESGVVVIKHWLIHNTIRLDRYHETQYKEEKNRLKLKENKAYTELATNGRHLVAKRLTEVKLSKSKLNKVKLSKSNVSEALPRSESQELFNLFYETINPNINFANKTDRSAADWLIGKYGLEKVLKAAKYAISIQGVKYTPTITTPYQLKEKMSALAKYKQQAEKPTKGFLRL